MSTIPVSGSTPVDFKSGAQVRTWLVEAALPIWATVGVDRWRGGLLEGVFDGAWQPIPGAGGRMVEPARPFEWAWLLIRWATRRARSDVLVTALRPPEIGKTHGVDDVCSLAVNAFDNTLRVTDANARLWPRTERIRAWRTARTNTDSTAGPAASVTSSARSTRCKSAQHLPKRARKPHDDIQ